MSKVFKWLALILGVLTILVVGITFFVRFYLTGDLITAWIIPPLERYLHRDVTISDSRIGLRGFRAGGLEIRKEGARAPLLKGEQLELRWKFRELFKGRIVIDTLVFSEPEINFIRNEDGSLNIADLLPQESLSEPAAVSGKRAKREPSGVHLLISLLAVEDGRLTLVDRSRQPPATLQATHIRARVNDLSTLTAVPFEMEGLIEEKGKGSFTINGAFNLAKGNVTGNLKLQGIDLAILHGFSDRKSPDVIQHGGLTLQASIEVDEYDHIKGKGSFNLTGLQIKRGEELSKALDLEAGFQLDALISQQTLSVDALDLTLNGQQAKVQGLFTQWNQRPQLNFTFSSPQIKLDELLALLPRSSPPSGTGETTAEQATAQEDSAPENPETAPRAESPSASSSDAPVKQAEDTGEDRQTAPNSANVTDHAAKTVGEPSATDTTTGAALESIASEPPPEPIALDAQGEIHFDWLFYHKLVVSNVDCHLRLLDGKLQLEPLSASIYGGGLGASVKADVGSLGPPFECRIYSENILLDEILGAFWPSTRGSWSGNVNQISLASGLGSDLSAIEVHTDLNINEAEFSGHPLLLKLAELFQTEDLQQLQFSQVTARILTRQGVAAIKRLHMVGPILQVEGGGTAGLLDKRLDLRLHLQIRTQYVGKLASLREIVPKISEEQGFVELSVNVSGTFDEPIYRLDEGWLAKLTEEAAEEPAKNMEQEVLATSPLSEKEEDKLEEEPQTVEQ